MTIAGYQFPRATEDDWLIVRGEVRLDDREWTFQDPSLDTFEVARLIHWLEALVSGVPTTDWVDIVEPNLTFERLNTATIRVSFWAESAPAWAKASGRRPGFDIPVGPNLMIAAGQLRTQLARFPHRGEEG
ncbi:WapI family immunity protein [Caulobacter sp. AP07]|uniref:WapI family immunity protein n=1 Tax=Caulobacter sp. AP07 TaxID=1144304 RepID=UPI0012FA494F|nr:hypothetical protein [Caulobacter sp. AP07]